MVGRETQDFASLQAGAIKQMHIKSTKVDASAKVETQNLASHKEVSPIKQRNE